MLLAVLWINICLSYQVVGLINIVAGHYPPSPHQNYNIVSNACLFLADNYLDLNVKITSIATEAVFFSYLKKIPYQHCTLLYCQKS